MNCYSQNMGNILRIIALPQISFLKQMVQVVIVSTNLTVFLLKLLNGIIEKATLKNENKTGNKIPRLFM